MAVICPNCGGETFVSRTHEADEKPSRVRICLRCGRSGVTHEVWADVEERQTFQMVLNGILTEGSREQARGLVRKWKEEGRWGSGCRSRCAP
jgi:uncharacterized Zn finger protein (UPF0148 family)